MPDAPEAAAELSPWERPGMARIVMDSSVETATGSGPEFSVYSERRARQAG